MRSSRQPVYRNLPVPYPTVQLPTPYGHLFSNIGVPPPPPRHTHTHTHIACCQASRSAILATSGLLVLCSNTVVYADVCSSATHMLFMRLCFILSTSKIVQFRRFGRPYRGRDEIGHIYSFRRANL